MNSLSDANLRWHRALEKSYQDFLELLTALELDLAGHRWQEFRHSLSTHIEFEKKHIEPLALKREDNTLKLIQSDHVILNRLLPRLDTAIECIRRADSPRTELVKQLNVFVKLRNVLEHHDLRETEHLYPLLNKEVDHIALETLGQKMDAARTAPFQ